MARASVARAAAGVRGVRAGRPRARGVDHPGADRVRRPAHALGFKLVMLALLLGLFFVYDREHALAKIVVALAGSVGTHYVFERFLRVPLPDASLPALRSLGF